MSSGREEGAPAAPSSQAAAFLHETFRHADDGVLLGWSKAGSLWWNSDELDDAAAAFTTRGAERNIWVGCGFRATPSANGGRGTDRDVVGIPGLWADVDEPLADVVPAFEVLKCPPSQLLCSGHHTHAWWLADEFWMFSSDHERVEARTLLRRLHTFLRAQGWRVDAVHGLARVMRVPGTLNHKTSPPVPVTLHDNGQPRRYALSELDEWLPPGEPASLPGDHTPLPTPNISVDEIDRLAASWAAGDERFAKTWTRQRDDFESASEYDLAVCVKGADMGADDATSWALVRRWRQRHGEDPAKTERDDYAIGTLAKARAGAPPTVYDVADANATAALLDDTRSFLRRFLVADDAAFTAGALWVAHTWAFDAADATPRLSIRSAEAESGKTRWLEALKLTVRGPIFMVGVSDAALFRLVERGGCTVLLDEVDTVFGPKARDREDLRGLLDAGYERGAQVPRCVGDGSDLKVRMFAVFAPVAFAGLGKLPPHARKTLGRGAHEATYRQRTNRAAEPPEGAPHRRSVARPVGGVGGRRRPRLADAGPALPEELGDRAQDVWEPLLAIADIAGEAWAGRARAAAVELYATRDQDDESIGRRLLADVRAVFDDPERDDPVDEAHGPAIASGALAAALAAIEGAPWAEWSRDDKPITATKVARLLKPFGIWPDQHKICGKKLRGYLQDDFEDAWRRHLPAQSGTDAEVVPANASKGKGGTTLRPVPLPAGKGAPDGEGGE